MKTDTKKKSESKKSDEKVPAIILTNRYAHVLSQVLNKPMHGQASRDRNIFVKNLQPFMDEYEDQRRKLNDRHAKVGKDGKPILDENGRPEMKDESLRNKEWSKIGDQPVIFDVLPSTKPSLVFVRDYLIKTRDKFIDACIPERQLTEEDIVTGNFKGKKVGDTIKINDEETGKPEANFTYDQQEYVDMLDDLIQRFKEGI